MGEEKCSLNVNYEHGTLPGIFIIPFISALPKSSSISMLEVRKPKLGEIKLLFQAADLGFNHVFPGSEARTLRRPSLKSPSA